MTKFFLITSLITLSVSLSAQTSEGVLRMEKTFGGTKFYLGNKLVKPNEVLPLMQGNQEAYLEFKKAKSNYGAAQVFGFIGGFMIGWPIGTALGGGDPEWGLAAGGAGFILLSIPFSSAFNKHAKNAVEIYNRGPGSASARPYSVIVMPHGAGAKLLLKF